MALVWRPLVAVLAVASATAAAGCDLTALVPPGVARQSRDDGYYACLNIPPGVAHALHNPKQAARTAGEIRTMLHQTLPQDDAGEALKGCASALHVPVSKLVAEAS